MIYIYILFYNIYMYIYICIHMPAIRGRFLPTMLGNRMPLGDLLKKNMAGQSSEFSKFAVLDSDGGPQVFHI
jgi:hypothetical protein